MTADELLTTHLLEHLRLGNIDYAEIHPVVRTHLANCPDARITDTTGQDGSYGCDTGCEYLTLTCTAQCPHYGPHEASYGTFGDLASLIEDLGRKDA